MAEMNVTVLQAVSIKTTESNQSSPAFTVGNAGTTISQIVSTTTAFDFGSVSASSFIEQDFVVPGAAATCHPFVSVQDSTYSGTYRSLVFDAKPSAANAVTVKVSNNSTAAINPNSLTFRVTAINF